MGIMFALQYAGVPANAEADDFLYQVTSRLGVAFTTTLLALIMSAVLVLLRLGDGPDGKASSNIKVDI